MKRLLIWGCVVMLMGMADPATAQSSVSNVSVTMVDVRADGTFLINTSAAIVNSPACVIVNNRMSGNANSRGGRVLLQGALSAFLGMKKVNVQGAGGCNEYGGIESLYLLQIK